MTKVRAKCLIFQLPLTNTERWESIKPLADRWTSADQNRHKWLICTLLLNSSLWPVEKSPKINEFPSCLADKKGCIFHLYDSWIYSGGVWFWALKDISPSPPLRVTYIPHLFYLSPEHHARILRKHLHFHPATASQTAQTTCKRDRKDRKLQQETEHPNKTETVLLF